MKGTFEIILVNLIDHEYNSIAGLADGVNKTKCMVSEDLQKLKKLGFITFLKSNPRGKTNLMAKKPVLTEKGREVAILIKKIKDLK